MIKRHDPALGRGLLMSFCISHPDDVRCAGILLATYVSARKYAEAVEVLDHFSYPECRIDTIDCPEWGIALTVLQKDEEFKRRVLTPTNESRGSSINSTIDFR